MNGIMIYGFENHTDLKLRHKYLWLKELFSELQAPLITNSEQMKNPNLDKLIELKRQNILNFIL